jgi:trimeric autotransporter adhesin
MSRLKNLGLALGGAAALALVAVAAGAGANGGNFILGAANTATVRTTLSATTSDIGLQVTNNGGGIPLGVTAPSGQPPMKVNSGVKVTNLNVDKLDGIDSTGFWTTTGNSVGSSAFLRTTNSRTLQLRANNLVALRLEPGDGSAPNVIGGASTNSATSGIGGATIAGGGSYLAPSFGNTVTNNWGTVGGGQRNSAGLKATVGGGDQNSAMTEGDTVSGGKNNTATGNDTTVGGGIFNSAVGSISTIAGGYQNGVTLAGSYAAIGGGFQNNATGSSATIAGGTQNAASDNYATVGGGYVNTASAPYATVIGGRESTASADYSTVAGGQSNTASGVWSFAAGQRAVADDNGAFVWADEANADVQSPGADTFTVRAAGGIWLGTNSSPSITPGHFIDTSTTAYLSSAGAWVDASDRALKHDFRALDKSSVLDKVGRIPISSWSYKAETPSVRHIGPTAQDFYKAFGLGLDNKHIGTIDEGGVALAAIQGLYKQNLALKARLAKLERKVAGMGAAHR